MTTTQEEQEQFDEFLYSLAKAGYVMLAEDPETGRPLEVARWSEDNCRFELTIEHDAYMLAIIRAALRLGEPLSDPLVGTSVGTWIED
jgi:hypothetical protein